MLTLEQEEAGGEGVEPPTRVGGESEVDVDGEYRAYGRDGLSEGVSATKRRQQLAAAKAEPVIDYSKPWDFKSKKARLLFDCRCVSTKISSLSRVLQ